MEYERRIGLSPESPEFRPFPVNFAIQNANFTIKNCYDQPQNRESPPPKNRESPPPKNRDFPIYQKPLINETIYPKKLTKCDSPKQEDRKERCFFFRNVNGNYCKKGSNCRFEHTICIGWVNGHCNNASKCNFGHPSL
jgi:hypothetical protein